MPRSIRAPALETRTGRLKLKIVKRPYWARVGHGLSLGYRRNQGPGTWSIRVAKGGRGRGHWTKIIAAADDYDAADGDTVLTFWQAQDKARSLGLATRCAGNDAGKLGTVGQALDSYEADLKLRGGDTYNVRRVRLHMPQGLNAKAVASLAVRDFRPWTAVLTKAELAPASINRSNNVLKAALNHAADHDERITTRTWDKALANIPDAVESRNVILDEGTIRAIVANAHRVSTEFGLLVEIAAVTGARVSQIARLKAHDLQADRPDPRLIMPSSRKGKGTKKVRNYPIPIPANLAVRLSSEAKDRPVDAPLLIKPNGDAWKKSDHSRLFARTVALAGLDAAEPTITFYALRHSNIVRQLLAGTPIRLVAAAHDTSVRMIEATYSRYITDVSDAPLRRALLDLSERPIADNVIPLAQGQSQ
jgi:integrase